MNHLGLVSHEPPALLLFNSPLIPGAHFDEIKINLILKLFRVLSRTAREPGRAAHKMGVEFATGGGAQI